MKYLASIEKEDKILSKNIAAFGTTSEGQARRLAEWHMLTATELETELVSFATGLNAIFLRPGDIINVQDKRQYNFKQVEELASTLNASKYKFR